MTTMPSVNDEFLTLEALEEAAQAAAKAQGFAFSRCKTTTIRKQSSMVWVVTKVEYVHNHSLLLSDEVLSFPQHRKLNINQKKLLNELHIIGTPTHIITTAINQFSNGGVIVPKDVVNQRARIRYVLNEGPNADSAQKLLRLLQQCDYIIELLKTQHGYLTYLFFSHIEAAKHTVKCPEVLIIDSTYKTNVYKYPLVTTMENENEESYKWVLKTLRNRVYNIYSCLPSVFMLDRDKALCNASKKIFPEADKMLCTWHLVEQNLKTNCHKLFENDDDYLEFKKAVETLQLAFDKEHIKVAIKSITNTAKKAYDSKKPVIYVKTLMEDSKLWIYAFTKNYYHMGILTTTHAESSHSAFKCAIETASGLETVACNPFTLHDPRFSMIIGYISIYAIDKIKRTLATIEVNSLIYKDTETCQCSIRINYKLLCHHMISKEGLSTNDPEFYKIFLKAEEIFHQLPDDTSMRAELIAHIDQVITMPLFEPVKAPNISVSKGRPLKTKREKLMSERQDLNAKKKKKLLYNSQSELNKANSLYSSPIVNCQNINYYKDSIPNFMHEYILSYTNVNRDENCNFHAIAMSLEMSEDEWPTIRHMIFNELVNRKNHYIRLFLEGETEFNSVISIVQWEKGPCEIDY
ncbi:10934_t:CDS:2 [Cetraspora pellucida]|uniref:10934_t:CDS:1 n=1 Tax=Cetraspora pellucida TaxID=1433469 RepID=A0A9N9E3P5_9GLOM|nr:10934_t:CDS:2 [Cetraspora pellucida]